MICIENCLNLTGRLIISMPSSGEITFGNSVVYICGHDVNGAVGIIINKPVKSIDFYELLSQIEISYDTRIAKNEIIHFGGPIDIGRGFVLHSSEKKFPDTVRVSDDIGLTSSVDILKSVISGKGPKNKIIAIGYMYWKPGQLETELANNNWLVSGVADTDFVFNTDARSKWMKSMQQIGIKREINLSSVVGHS